MARLVFLVSRAVSVLCVVTLLVAAAFDAQAARYTAGRAPTEFARRLDPGLTGDYGRVIGVAHNAGDDTGAATRAVAYGADAIEIDVRSSGGELFASHDAPIPLLEDVFFRGPSLGEAWKVAQLRGTVLLHLKEHSPAYLERVRAFLLTHPRQRVIIQTHDPATLRWARRRLPFAERLLLVFDAERARALRTDPRLLADADGVSVDEPLLTRGLLGWLQRRRLTTFAWTVDDEARLNQLVAGGVDGVITNRLDFMRVLGDELGARETRGGHGGRAGGRRRLRRRQLRARRRAAVRLDVPDAAGLGRRRADGAQRCSGFGEVEAAARVPLRALVAVRRDPAGVLEHPREVHEVPGHERRVAVGEVVLRAARARGRGSSGRGRPRPSSRRRPAAGST